MNQSTISVAGLACKIYTPQTPCDSVLLQINKSRLPTVKEKLDFVVKLMNLFQLDAQLLDIWTWSEKQQRFYVLYFLKPTSFNFHNFLGQEIGMGFACYSIQTNKEGVFTTVLAVSKGKTQTPCLFHILGKERHSKVKSNSSPAKGLRPVLYICGSIRTPPKHLILMEDDFLYVVHDKEWKILEPLLLTRPIHQGEPQLVTQPQQQPVQTLPSVDLMQKQQPQGHQPPVQASPSMELVEHQFAQQQQQQQQMQLFLLQQQQQQLALQLQQQELQKQSVPQSLTANTGSSKPDPVSISQTTGTISQGAVIPAIVQPSYALVQPTQIITQPLPLPEFYFNYGVYHPHMNPHTFVVPHHPQFPGKGGHR